MTSMNKSVQTCYTCKMKPASPRKILHIDMDCFYAAVEIRDNPNLQNHPVAVGGNSQQRGVLTTCNYLARQYGLHSAMPTYQALARCPNLVLVPVNMPKYKAASQAIHSIFREYTDIIEPLSLDEAYLDVTHCTQHHGSATLIAQAIRERIVQEQNLTASAGVAPNKLLAKIASDWHKPNGQCVIRPDAVDDFIKPLPVSKLFGVGKATAAKLAQLGIATCGDLQSLTPAQLVEYFGRFGTKLYDYAQGIDHRPVEPNRLRKSVSVESTYPENLDTLERCLAKLPELFTRLTQRCALHSERVMTKHYVKMKFADFTKTSVECVASQLDITICEHLLRAGFTRNTQPIRLLGIGVRFDTDDSDYVTQQLELVS